MVLEVDGGPRLEVPDEPEELKDRLRSALLAGEDRGDGPVEDRCIAVWLWRCWRPALEPLGTSREEFVETVIASKRELWLWLTGERPWFQYLSGLAGQVVRRMPAPAA
jgi:hypothetical protein